MRVTRKRNTCFVIVSLVSKKSILFFCNFSKVNLPFLIIIIVTVGCLSAKYFMQLNKYNYI